MATCSNQTRAKGSGVARGAGGGHLPPAAARRGAPKSCQKNFKNLYMEKFLKISKNKMNM